MADMGDEAQIFWEDIEHQQMVQTAGIEAMENTRMPILEIIVDKNKISGFKGTLFFKMWPLSGHLEECLPGEIERYGSLLGSFETGGRDPARPDRSCDHHDRRRYNSVKQDSHSVVCA